MSLENMRYLVYTMYSIVANVNGTMIHSMVIAGQLLGECGALWGERERVVWSIYVVQAVTYSF